MSELTSALLYFPYLYYDKKEPFPVKLVGYHIFRYTGKSLSFDREIVVDRRKVDYVIEYAIYFDYDIQHMYDLEHIWIYVGKDGTVVDAECSSHGRFLNCWRYRPIAEDGRRITLYSQPGKHAFFPEGNLFLLFSDYEEVCGEKAGADGLLIPPQLKGLAAGKASINEQVRRKIQEEFAFRPSLEFEKREIPERCFLPEEELFPAIAERIHEMLEKLERQNREERMG